MSPSNCDLCQPHNSYPAPGERSWKLHRHPAQRIAWPVPHYMSELLRENITRGFAFCMALSIEIS